MVDEACTAKMLLCYGGIVLNMLSFKGDETHPFCPKCGTNLEAYSRELDDRQLCPHIRLIYSDFAGDIIYCHDDLHKKILRDGGYDMLQASLWDVWLLEHERNNLHSDELQTLKLYQEHPVTIIMKKFAESDWFCLSVHSPGFTCGPMFETVYVVYDMSV